MISEAQALALLHVCFFSTNKSTRLMLGNSGCLANYSYEDFNNGLSREK